MKLNPPIVIHNVDVAYCSFLDEETLFCTDYNVPCNRDYLNICLYKDLAKNSKFNQERVKQCRERIEK